MKRYVIVGGVAGGATAAARLRRRDESAEIVVIERGKYVSFANCGLPYHIGEVISERDALLVSTPEKLNGEFNIDVRVQHEVIGIDRDAHTVQVRDLVAGTDYDLEYNKLVLSPGAVPFVPPIEGADLDGVYTLRDIPGMDVIKRRVDEGHVKSALVIGGGFIGIETAENLLERGIEVTVVEMLPQVMAPLDPDMAAHLHREIRDAGVRLRLGDGVTAISPKDGRQLGVTLSSGRSVTVDMVIMSIGVRPESALAKLADLEIGPRGHIAVNDQMQTSDPDIYAVGDAIQVVNPITNSMTAVPLAGPANRQARIAADHITGLDVAYRGTIGTSIVKVFDLTAATTGMNSHALGREGVDYKTAISHSYDHVGYYPGATRQAVKVLFGAEDGRVLGAQVVGYHAVDRTVDVFAMAIQAGMTVFDLEHSELAYAPPYGAAKDAVNVAAFVAANVLRGDSELVEWSAIEGRDPDKVGLLDVREQIEYELGHIEGAIHIPNEEMRERLSELDKAKEWWLYCSVGRRAYVMERLLKQMGYRAKNISGGWSTYEAASEQQDNFDEWTPEVEPTTALEAISPADVVIDAQVNACGLQCPGPIMAVYKQMEGMDRGQVLEVLASDPGFKRDVNAWAERTGNAVLDVGHDDGTIRALIVKGDAQPQIEVSDQGTLPTNKTMVVFSADLDRALAAFVIANGAAAMGQKVTMFFTFWGLNILRKATAEPVQKNLIEKMFGWMMPKGPDALKLSNLHMGGMGTAMIKGVMRDKNIDSLPKLIQSARDAGVTLMACQMSMDMMGIKEEELLDGVEVGGVATYINETDKASASLFI